MNIIEHISRISNWKTRYLAAIASGLLFSASFAPLNWWVCAWFALVPLLVLPIPLSRLQRWITGLLLGYAYFATNLHWLNEVGFGAGWILAAICAVYPALWYVMYCSFALRLRKLFPAHYNGVFTGLIYCRESWPIALQMFFASASWVALEWLRGFLFTGFPWNQIGISQVNVTSISPLAAFGGAYLIGALLICFNCWITVTLFRRMPKKFVGDYRPLSYHHLLMLAFLTICTWLIRSEVVRIKRDMADVPQNGEMVRIGVVQGNLPLRRAWAPEDFYYAISVYGNHTRQLLEKNQLDLIVWPESAIPCPIVYASYRNWLKNLVTEIKTPMLIGAIDVRLKPGTKINGKITDDDVADFNSAFLLTPQSGILYDPNAIRKDVYDKIHIVPFGEYVPFSKYLPWLADLIGMGRDLTPGNNYQIFNLGKKVKIGVNICFEDAFAGISRKFVGRGANLLMTITNDVWYGTSSGARQHLALARFRAIENGRFLLRSGNNSDTCLIAPNGKVVFGTFLNENGGEIYGESRFAETDMVAKFVVPTRPSMTFYAKHGDIFAYAMLAIGILEFFWLCIMNFQEKRRNLAAMEN